MQRHVLIRLQDELKTKKLFEAVYQCLQTSHNVSPNDKTQVLEFSHPRCFSNILGNDETPLSRGLTRVCCIC